MKHIIHIKVEVVVKTKIIFEEFVDEEVGGQSVRDRMLYCYRCWESAQTSSFDQSKTHDAFRIVQEEFLKKK